MADKNNTLSVNVRLTAGDQIIPLGHGLWCITLFIRSTSVTVTGTLQGATDVDVDVLGVQRIGLGAGDTITEGASAITGNTMVRFVAGVSSAISTNHLNVMTPYVSVVRNLKITIASPVALAEVTLVANKIS